MKKMNRTMAVVIVVMGLFWGCGQDKYGEVVEFNDKFVSATQNYIDGLNKAESGKDVAKAMDKYTEEFKKLAPKMKEINEKYSELMTSENLPEAVKVSQAKTEKIGAEFAASFMKTMQYMSDPQVLEAQMRMTQVMQSFPSQK